MGSGEPRAGGQRVGRARGSRRGRAEACPGPAPPRPLPAGPAPGGPRRPPRTRGKASAVPRTFALPRARGWPGRPLDDTCPPWTRELRALTASLCRGSRFSASCLSARHRDPKNPPQPPHPVPSSPSETPKLSGSRLWERRVAGLPLRPALSKARRRPSTVKAHSLLKIKK